MYYLSLPKVGLTTLGGGGFPLMILVNFLLGCIELGFRILISPDFPLGFVLQNDFLVTLHNLRDELEPG